MSLVFGIWEKAGNILVINLVGKSVRREMGSSLSGCVNLGNGVK